MILELADQRVLYVLRHELAGLSFLRGLWELARRDSSFFGVFLYLEIFVGFVSQYFTFAQV